MRRWTRWIRRAGELKVAIPDSTLLVSGLDTLTSKALAGSPEAQFRIQTFRHQHGVDHVPTESKAVSLGQMLQAELQIMESAGSNKKPKLAKFGDFPGNDSATDSTSKGEPKGKGGSKGKSGDQGGKGLKACWHWLTKGGCKLGASCHFKHDREALNSAPDVSNRCYTCSGVGHKSTECPSQGHGGNEGKGTNTGSQADSSKGKGQKGKGGNKNGVVKKVEEDAPQPSEQAKLLSAATSLLEQMQLKALSDIEMIHRLAIKGHRTGLIDSGASTCLRQEVGDETARLPKKVVDLAQGTAELYTTPCGTLVSEEPVETIVALGPLIRLGCRLQWGEWDCMLWHPVRGKLRLDISSGCPRVGEELALELITEIEQHRMHVIGAAVKALYTKAAKALPDQGTAISNLTHAVLSDEGVAACLGEVVLSLWPETPHTLLQELTAWAPEDASTLVFNRRKRRSIARAGKVLVHMFAGESRKEIERLARERGYAVLSIGIDENINSTQTFRYVLGLAAQGKLDVLWCAPPCGTNSLCRFVEPGPQPLRGRCPEWRWGVSWLTEPERRKAQEADEMYLRMLLVLHVAQEGNKLAQRTAPWSLVEGPRDPEQYIHETSELWKKARGYGGFPSIFATQEFQTSAQLLGLVTYLGDQGPYGHPRQKPTAWCSTRPLPELKKGPGSGIERQPQGSGEWQSSTWARWAPGMIRLLGDLLGKLDGSTGDQLKKAEVDWEKHIRQGHWPPLRNCRVCIGCNARHRAHRRVSHPASWVLSLDTIGPFSRTEDETSRDLRFALVGCLLVPVDETGKPVLGSEQTQGSAGDPPVVGSEQAQGSAGDPKSTDIKHPSDAESDEDLWQAMFGELAEENANSHQEKGAEYQDALKRCEEDAQGLSLAEKTCVVPGLAWKEIIFVEPMRRKTPTSVVQMTEKILSEINEMGFPVTRIHSDCGTEFITPQMRALVCKHSIKQTSAAPEEHNANGRVESVIGRLKAQARTYIHHPSGGVETWPLALRAVAASWRQIALRGMGYKLPEVVPFGTRVQVLARSWLRRQKKSWSLKAVDAVVMCPASLVKLGYVVRIGKRLSVVTKLFHGQDPPDSTEDAEHDKEPPVAHSTGPENRITGKSTIPPMSHVPAPSRRTPEKSPGPGRVPVLKTLCPNQTEEDQHAAFLATQAPFDVTAAESFLSTCTFVTAPHTLKPSQKSKAISGHHYVFGVFRHGGVVGITKNCNEYPGMRRLLAAYANVKCPGSTYSTVILSVDAFAPPHKDSTNSPNSLNHWIPIKMPPSGGRVWVQDGEKIPENCCDVVHGEPCSIKIRDKLVAGHIKPSHAPITFSPSSWHATEPWDPQHRRIAVLLYTVDCLDNLPLPNKTLLQQLNFALPALTGQGGDHPSTTKVLKASGLDQGLGLGSLGEGLNSGLNWVSDDGQGSDVERGENKSREWFCRLCESSEVLDLDSRCSSCGCLAAAGHDMGVTHVGESREVEDTKNPYKNSITPYKNEPESQVVQNNSLEDGHEVLGDPPGSRDEPCGEHGLSMVDYETCIAWVGGRHERVHELEWCVGVYDVGCCDQHEHGCVLKVCKFPDNFRDGHLNVGDNMVDCVVEEVLLEACGLSVGTHAEGLDSSPEDANQELHGGCVEHGHNEGDEACSREYEAVLWEGTEGLRESGMWSAQSRDVHDFSRWLDESQLRLATACEEDIQAWINEEDPVTERDHEARDRLVKAWQDVEDLRYELKRVGLAQLSADCIQLARLDQDQEPDQSEILQTRIIATAEALANWDLWRPAAEAEIRGLIDEKEALELVDQAMVEKWQREGRRVSVIPSKAIFAIKAPTGRLKVRVVACGNFLAQQDANKRVHKENTYTPSVAVEALRSCLSFAVRRKFVLFSLDIKCAFLNASLLPRNRQEARDTVAADCGEEDRNNEPQSELVVLIPPRPLVRAQLFRQTDRLLIRRAVYGLDQAPRDWQLVKDTKLQLLRIQCRGRVFRLFPSFAEEQVWLISVVAPRRGLEATLWHDTTCESIAGWLLAYVDDVLIGADRELAKATAEAICATWECTPPEEVGSFDRKVRFLGVDLFWDSSGNLFLSQEAYIRDLCSRYEEELKPLGKPAVPMAAAFREDAQEPGSVQVLRKTQAIVGALLWAAVRTRPDISYTIARLSAKATQAPEMTYQCALHALAYLSHTAALVLKYTPEDKGLGDTLERRESNSGTVLGFGDASFAPEAQRSVQGLLVYVEENLVGWSVTRQALMAQSSCEAEMTALMDLAVFTQSTGFLVDELLQRASLKEIGGDNLASLAIYGGTQTHWRTRHLKIKARAFHEKNHEGDLPAVHIPGEINPSDIGTKGLPSHRHWRLIKLLGLEEVPTLKKVSVTQGGSLSMNQCLRAVVLACCLCACRGQPEREDVVADRVLLGIGLLVVIASVAVWELLRFCVRGIVDGSCCCRRQAVEPEAEGQHVIDEPQPDVEDDLVDHNNPLAPPIVPTPPPEVPPPQEGLRRRGQRIYAPEPDHEPQPILGNDDDNSPQHLNPPPPPDPNPLVMQYVDDVAVGVPNMVQGVAPPQLPDPARIPIRDYEEVRRQVLQEEAERRVMDLPVFPALTVNPHWGPAPVQPTLRQVRRDANMWGGPESAVYHNPPVIYRRDFYQFDARRGVLIRWHCQARIRLFTPDVTRFLPVHIELHMLTGRRRTFVHTMQRTFFIEDRFRDRDDQRHLEAQWRGRTEIQIDPTVMVRLRVAHAVD